MDAPAKAPVPHARRWAAIVLVLTFVAGALAGGGAVHLHHACLWDDGSGDGPPRRLPPPLRALDLSAEQERQVREVVERYHPRLQDAMRESWPQMKPVFDEMAVEIKAFLDPAQQARFDEERKKMEERRLGPHGGHP